MLQFGQKCIPGTSCVGSNANEPFWNHSPCKFINNWPDQIQVLDTLYSATVALAPYIGGTRNVDMSRESVTDRRIFSITFLFLSLNRSEYFSHKLLTHTRSLLKESDQYLVPEKRLNFFSSASQRNF